MNETTIMRTDVQLLRLERRLQERDRKIAGLRRRVAALERALATKDLEGKRLPHDVTRAVQEALCNIRMIPVPGIRSNDKIVEVRDATHSPSTYKPTDPTPNAVRIK